jgi:glycosyltransferase involved in cell wall biosynthesis
MHEKLSIIVPVHNEAENIRKNILRLERYLNENCPFHEIVLSEDGSTDRTAEILRKLAGGRIILLHDDRRLGKGAAISKAIGASSGDYIFIMDADLPVGLDCIQKMTRLLPDYDIVLGSRLIRGSETIRSGQREFLSKGYNLLARLLFRTGVKDHQCGVKAIKRSALKKIVPIISARGFFWDTEMIVRARMNGLRIAEFPIRWEERSEGESKVLLYKDIFGIGTSVIKFWIKVFVFRE